MELCKYLEDHPYPGRLVLSGYDRSGRYILAYALTGRSSNSRNRILVLEDGVLKTRAYDESLVEDPSLIIYDARTEYEGRIILTNGDHTDTILDCFRNGFDLEKALALRTYEPDSAATPRIGVVLDRENGKARFFILKKDGDRTERLIYNYEKQAGIVHVIHTYENAEDPLISFSGLPRRFELDTDDVEELALLIWNSLDKDNRISLYVNINGEERIINSKEVEA